MGYNVTSCTGCFISVWIVRSRAAVTRGCNAMVMYSLRHPFPVATGIKLANGKQLVTTPFTNRITISRRSTYPSVIKISLLYTARNATFK